MPVTDQKSHSSASSPSPAAEPDDEEKLQFLMSDPEEPPDGEDDEVLSAAAAEADSPLPPLPFAAGSASASAAATASASTGSSGGVVGISGRRKFGYSLVIQQLREQHQQAVVAGSAPAATNVRALSRQHSRHSTATGTAAATASALSHRAKSACLSAFGLAVAGDRRAALSDKWSQRRLMLMTGFTGVRIEKLQHQQQPRATEPGSSFASPPIAEGESLGTSGSTGAPYSLVSRQLSSPSVRFCHHHAQCQAEADHSAVNSLSQATSSSSYSSSSAGFHYERPNAVSTLLRGTASVISSSSSSWRQRRRRQLTTDGRRTSQADVADGLLSSPAAVGSARVELAQMNNSYDDSGNENAGNSSLPVRSSTGSGNGSGKFLRTTNLARIVRDRGAGEQQTAATTLETPIVDAGAADAGAAPEAPPSVTASPFDRQFRSYVRSANSGKKQQQQPPPQQQQQQARGGGGGGSVPASLLSCFGVRLLNDPSTAALQRDIDQSLLHRPFFTYWITLVHVLVFFGTLFTFGFAPVGVTVYNTRLAEITTRNMLSAKVCAIDYHNLFIGPRLSDLIRVGAKYSLCMRRYDKLYKDILDPQRAAENQTGCCIHNDGSACFQSPAAGCSSVMSTWVKWTPKNPSPDKRISGAVCGQDPLTCQEPRSTGQNTWPDDITRWPACLRPGPPISSADGNGLNHLNCPISARPCCVGIKGECVMTTQHRCEFLRGTFFPERHLCSQVNCLSDACGMLGIADQQHPGQFYRLFTSLFLHAGLITLAITLLHHLLFLRRLEQLAGWHRTALIYIGSGVMGNLVSINFLPYLVDVGPTSAQVGSLAPILIEFGMSWRFVANRCRSVAIFLMAFAVLLGLGFFPWFDNFANVGGLASGCLLSVVLLPYIHRGSSEQSAYRCRLISVCACSLIWLGACLVFGAIFYLAPVSSCSWCVYFNCGPKWFESGFTDKNFVDYCGNADLDYLEPTRCIERLNTGMDN